MSMLESNTDRMFFTIGTVIVAGLIIAGGVNLISGSFSGSVNDAMGSLFGGARQVVGLPEKFPTITDADAVVNTSGRLTSYTGSEKKITIPTTLDGRTVTQIGSGSSSAFGSGAVTHVAIPSSVTHINWSAFGSNLLDEIDIPAGVSVHGSGGVGSRTSPFLSVYDNNGRQAGRYVWDGSTYIKQ